MKLSKIKITDENVDNVLDNIILRLGNQIKKIQELEKRIEDSIEELEEHVDIRNNK